MYQTACARLHDDSIVDHGPFHAFADYKTSFDGPLQNIPQIPQ